ncbi:flagellar FlbD family protein [bacterium]|nr:flagellar FlbD family protein [bacterium]
MIRVTRLDNTQIVINAEIIETIEEAPDTIISTTSNKKYFVKETAEQVIEKIIQYRKFIVSGCDQIFQNRKEEEI